LIDPTFDNRGLSLIRILINTAAALLFMLVCSLLYAVGGDFFGTILALVLGVVIWIIRSARHAHTLERQPASDIAQLLNGYLEIYGTAERTDGHELRDPIQNQPCIWFGIETLRHEKAKISMWLPFKRAASSRPFIVRDSTGACLVDPRGAQFIVEDCVEVNVNSRVKHRIWRIRDGDALTVVGEATRSGGIPQMRRPSGGKKYLIAGHGAA
jgi:hypothetical protein